jgi:predicted dehydrogenase
MVFKEGCTAVAVELGMGLQVSRLSRRAALGRTAGLSSVCLGWWSGPRAEAAESECRPLRVGVIGCGGRGTLAAAGLLAADPTAQVVAMADRSAAAVDLSAGLLGRSGGRRGTCPEGRRFSDVSCWQRVLDVRPDVVILATPAADRAAQIHGAIAAGVHLFCERPAAVSLEAVDGLERAAVDIVDRGLCVPTAMSLRRDETLRAAIARADRGRPPVVTYPAPARVGSGLARWSVEEAVIDAIDEALWATGDARVLRVRVLRNSATFSGPDAVLELADGRSVRIMPRGHVGRREQGVGGGGMLAAEGTDPERFRRGHLDLLAGLGRRETALPPAGGAGGRSTAPAAEFSRLLEATRGAILVAEAVAAA